MWMQTEYLLAYDDGTWKTEFIDVPIVTQDREKLVAWAEQNLAPLEKYRKVVLFALYSYNYVPR